VLIVTQERLDPRLKFNVGPYTFWRLRSSEWYSVRKLHWTNQRPLGSSVLHQIAGYTSSPISVPIQEVTERELLDRCAVKRKGLILF
jgi:hypothetical protein